MSKFSRRWDRKGQKERVRELEGSRRILDICLGIGASRREISTKEVESTKVIRKNLISSKAIFTYCSFFSTVNQPLLSICCVYFYVRFCSRKKNEVFKDTASFSLQRIYND